MLWASNPGWRPGHLYEQIGEGILAGLPGPRVPLPSLEGLDQPLSFLEGPAPAVVETSPFVARQRELARLAQFLDDALAGRGRVVFVTGDAGQGKTALIQEFARRALTSHSGLLVASGKGNAHAGMGDPYLPFREVLDLLTGDVGARWEAGAMSREQARRLWQILPLAAQALLEAGPDLIDTFLPGRALLRRAVALTPPPGDADWLARP